MNISNAIRNVERVFMNFPDIASEEDIESFEIAVEAMNKQDPMKPTYDHRYSEMGCSMCWNMTTNEVQRAISWAQGMEILYAEKEMPECVNCAKTAITALQAYQLNPTSKVQEAIKQKLTTDAIEYLNNKMKQPFCEKDGERNDI